MKYLVAFINKLRSSSLLDYCRENAKRDDHIILLKVISETNRTERVIEKAQAQLEEAAHDFRMAGLFVRTLVRMDEPGTGIVRAASDTAADVVLLGTARVSGTTRLVWGNDPIVHYVVNNCPASVLLMRYDDPAPDGVYNFDFSLAHRR